MKSILALVLFSCSFIDSAFEFEPATSFDLSFCIIFISLGCGIVSNLVANVDHSDHDCLLISILSHGESGWIYAKDAHYRLEDIWCYFTAPRCPTLAGKPKLFFIQACQGDRAITLNRTETDSSDNQSEYKIPIHADFLIAYSTTPGACT